jgi:hypothetical protein
MFILCVIILCVIVLCIIELINLLDLEFPAKDNDILELVSNKDKIKDYILDKKWNDKLKLCNYDKLPTIHQTQYSLLFPYYIENIGVVPFWYKSALIIKSIFEDKINKSNLKITKRDKLGLK